MANISHAFGFRPSRYMNGAYWNGMSQLYGFSTSQSSDAYIGDIVTLDSTNRSTGVSDVYAPGIPLVAPRTSALTTTAFRGVIAGFVPSPDFSMSATASLGLRYRVASTARYCWVIDDFDVAFEIEETNGNSYTSASNNAVNKVADIQYNAGNTTTGIAGVVLDASTVTTGSVRPLRVLRMTQRVDNFNFASTDTNSLTHFDVMLANSDLAQANTGA